MMDRVIMMESFSERGMCRTEAEESYPFIICRDIVVEAKMGTSTPVAVETGNIVAFGMGCVEGAEILFPLYHIVKFEISDDLFGRESVFHQAADDLSVFSGVGIKPFCVCHAGIVAKSYNSVKKRRSA